MAVIDPINRATSRKKSHNFNGLAGCVRQWRNRKGQSVGVYHGEESGVEEFGWVAVCESHHTCIVSETRQGAFDSARDCEQFCDDCREQAGISNTFV